MNRIVINKENQPSPEQFSQMVDRMMENATPFNLLMSAMSDLAAFEAKYKIPSDVFYARFMRGEMGDDIPFMHWAGQYELYLEERQKIEEKVSLVESSYATSIV